MAKIPKKIELLAPAGLPRQSAKRRIKSGRDVKLKRNKKRGIELLAPAGSLEKLKYALHYGADAVYVGLPEFSLRYRINDFDKKTLEEAVRYTHKQGKKIYVTANIYAHNVHLKKAAKHFQWLRGVGVDGLIISDPGLLSLAKKYLPKTEIHLSTQANATNAEAVKFWGRQGVKRVVLAREVTLAELKEIKRLNPKIELECFVHGAMCMSYSGRCILSKWMTGRSANLGDCAQPCRWKYNKISNLKSQISNISEMTVADGKGEVEIDLEEDDHGTYFFNSKDLNLLAHLEELKKAGVDSYKIEGRNKSVYYLAVVVRAYRKAIDATQNKETTRKASRILKEQQKELNDLVHRGYTAGFLLGNEPEHDFEASHNPSRYQFVGQVENVKDNIITVRVHNAIHKGDRLEIVSQDKNIKIEVKKMQDESGNEVASAHGGHKKRYKFTVNKKGIDPMSLICKVNNLE